MERLGSDKSVAEPTTDSSLSSRHSNDALSSWDPQGGVVTKVRQTFGANTVWIEGPDALWWLFSLRPGDWRQIFVPVSLLNVYKQWFSPEWKIVGQGKGSSRLGDLYLGTWSHDLPLEAHPPSVLRFLGTKRQLSRLTLPTSIQRVHTRNVDLGGALKGATANFLLVGFPQKCHIPSTPLRRSLRFALDFGVMESESVCDDSRCLTPDSIPTFAELSLPVVLPGSYGKTIKRPLLPHEVGALLHFPGWLSREQLRHLLAVTPPPLLGFTFIIDAVLPSLPHHRAVGASPLPPLAFPSIVAPHMVA